MARRVPLIGAGEKLRATAATLALTLTTGLRGLRGGGWAIAAIAFALTAGAVSPTGPLTAQTRSCPLSNCAFFDPLDTAYPSNDTRTNGPDPVLWGTSRIDERTNASQGALNPWPAATLTTCPGSPRSAPASAICNGALAEASNVDDAHTFALQAFYPRQPFDFAGRTGTVQFETDLLNQGTHASWADFGITDQPLPAPSGPNQGVATLPANGVFVDFSLQCIAGSPCSHAKNGQLGVQRFTVVRNYVPTVYAAGFPTTPGFTMLGAVYGRLNGAGAADQLNTVQIRISQSLITVLASDIGTTTLRPIASLDLSGDKLDSSGNPTNPPLTLSRGLIWLENQSYGPSLFGKANDHQFQWANVAFDGPVLARDLGYDVPDALTPRSDGSVNLGYADGTSGRSFGCAGADDSAPALCNVADPSTATAALVEATWWAQGVGGLTVSVNGNAPLASGYPWPDGTTYVWRTIAVQVPLAELQQGANTITIATDTNSDVVANIDLILVGAGGTVSPSPTS